MSRSGGTRRDQRARAPPPQPPPPPSSLASSVFRIAAAKRFHRGDFYCGVWTILARRLEDFIAAFGFRAAPLANRPAAAPRLRERPRLSSPLFAGLVQGLVAFPLHAHLPTCRFPSSTPAHRSQPPSATLLPPLHLSLSFSPSRFSPYSPSPSLIFVSPLPLPLSISPGSPFLALFRLFALPSSFHPLSRSLAHSLAPTLPSLFVRSALAASASPSLPFSSFASLALLLSPILSTDGRGRPRSPTSTRNSSTARSPAPSPWRRLAPPSPRRHRPILPRPDDPTLRPLPSPASPRPTTRTHAGLCHHRDGAVLPP